MYGASPDMISWSSIAVSRSGHSGCCGPISCSRHEGWVMKAVVTAGSKRGGSDESAAQAIRTALPFGSRRHGNRCACWRCAPARIIHRLDIARAMTVRPATENIPTAHRLAVVLQQLAQIVVGKQEPLRLSLACLLARGHLLIEDIPGVGKSTLAQALATVLGLRYARIQFTSDLLPADVLGVSVYEEHAQTFRFHAGPIFHSVVLADEINRAPPKTQSALLEAMEERQVSIDGVTRPLPEPFFVIATQNPVEQIGAYPLPESQLDRFLMAIELGYPDAAAERDLLLGGDRRAQIPSIVPLADAPTLIEWQREAAAAHVSPALLDYVQALLAASRGQQGGAQDMGMRRGLSPRAGLLLMAAARAWALLAGRPMVLPEDVQAVFPSVAGHRLAGGTRNGALHAKAL